MIDWVIIMIAEIACYAFVAYLGYKKKLDPTDRGLWKPEEMQEKTVHKLITGLFFFYRGRCCWLDRTSQNRVWWVDLRISGLLTTASGGMIVRKFRKWRGV